jgi:hypothetical protein
MMRLFTLSLHLDFYIPKVFLLSLLLVDESNLRLKRQFTSSFLFWVIGARRVTICLRQGN